MRISAALGVIVALAFLIPSLLLHRASAEPPPRVEFAADQVAGIARIVIDGKEVARFTAGGLEVRDTIRYGGLLVDQGPAHYNREIAP